MMTEPELRETQLSSREIFDGRILHVFEDTVRLPNGAAASREYLRHIGAVCVIPVLEDGSVLVERQYRYPVAQVLTEIPAGKLDAKDEDHLLAAQRELREETGLPVTLWDGRDRRALDKPRPVLSGLRLFRRGHRNVSGAGPALR